KGVKSISVIGVISNLVSASSDKSFKIYFSIKIHKSMVDRSERIGPLSISHSQKIDGLCNRDFYSLQQYGASVTIMDLFFSRLVALHSDLIGLISIWEMPNSLMKFGSRLLFSLLI